VQLDGGEGGGRCTRRDFLALGLAGVPAALAAACGSGTLESTVTPRDQGSPGSMATEGLLVARPRPAASGGSDGEPARVPTGLLPWPVEGSARDALLFVPSSYRPDRPAPLALMLHGAGGEPHGGLRPFIELADAAGLMLLAPASQRASWDTIRGRYGPDVAVIDRALDAVFARYVVAPARVAAAGFSDGASYALSLGLMNGGFLRQLIAFSPGFMHPLSTSCRPRIFVSHGTHDEILPIESCSRRIVPELRSRGYDVDYREFDGPHTVPPEIARAALDWLA
jgi:phospholipase/carboxylesterase